MQPRGRSRPARERVRPARLRLHVTIRGMSDTHIDTLILGQGLAGSLLARLLIRAGQSVCVIDDGHTSSSSTVAAGLVK